MKDINCWEQKFESCVYSDRLLGKLLKLNEKAKNKINIIEIKKAIYYAKKYHSDQKRDSGEPYYSHPLEVAFITANFLFRTDLIITAILHDVLEDTTMSKEAIEIIFGSKVANQVEDLTRVKENRKISSEEMVESLWQQKKFEVLFIKQLDRLHNMRTIGSKTPAKMKKIAEETGVIFLILSAYFEQIDIENELYRLCSNITDPIVSEYYNRYLQDYFYY
jgi:guanosine-3',5'-bis(diphosphate) 3'-pyrophosphohydrolase